MFKCSNFKSTKLMLPPGTVLICTHLYSNFDFDLKPTSSIFFSPVFCCPPVHFRVFFILVKQHNESLKKFDKND